MPARGGQSSILLLENWQMGAEDLKGEGRKGSQEGGKEVWPIGLARERRGSLGTQWLSVIYLLLSRPPLPFSLSSSPSALGHWGTAPFPQHVGTLLQRSERHRVSRVPHPPDLMRNHIAVGSGACLLPACGLLLFCMLLVLVNT